MRGSDFGKAVHSGHAPADADPIAVDCAAGRAARPEPALFYDLRVTDHDDGLPKANGYLPSQMLFSRHILPKLLRR